MNYKGISPGGKITCIETAIHGLSLTLATKLYFAWQLKTNIMKSQKEQFFNPPLPDISNKAVLFLATTTFF